MKPIVKIYIGGFCPYIRKQTVTYGAWAYIIKSSGLDRDLTISGHIDLHFSSGVEPTGKITIFCLGLICFDTDIREVKVC